MSDYQISAVRPNDRRAAAQLKALLEKEGIELDKNLDYTVGMYDEDYRLAATGSCYRNTLRCLAVDSARQGEGLLNQVVSHLVDYQCRRGNIDLFLYTKCSTAKFFSDLGFHEIARVENRVVFMENRRHGFDQYIENLKEETGRFLSRNPGLKEGAGTGAVVMNANPFTLGHQYLLDQAAAACRLLHVFVVSEEASLVPFAVRDRLVREGSAHLGNVILHHTGSYMISNATFPSYFLKDSETVIRAHACLDIEMFKRIAAALGITRRFVGEEPSSLVTGIYNQVMSEELERSGISCVILPRLGNESGVISASTVRALLREDRCDELKAFVPESTYHYLVSEEAAPLRKALRETGEVRHY